MNHSIKTISILAIFFALILILSACNNVGSADPTQASEPVNVTLHSIPDPPATGNVQLIFELLDDKGLPITGADIDVIADHTEMSGMTMQGKATDQGNGRYAITTDFVMSGMWKLTVQIKTPTIDYRKDIDLKIQ